MNFFDTIHLIHPPNPQAWARAVAVVGMFLLAEETRFAAPLLVAFWLNMCLILAVNVPRLRRTLRLLDVSLWYVLPFILSVLGAFALLSALGTWALMVAWIAHFALQAIYKLWSVTFDMGFTRRLYGTEPDDDDTVGFMVLLEGVALAITAACMAALAGTAPPLAFVAAATFGWLLTLMMCNWLGVLVVLQRND